MPEFFGLFSRSAFLVNKKSLFLQKCQCIELLTVFRLLIYLPPLPTLLQTFFCDFQILNFDVRKKGPSCLNWGQGGGWLGDSGNARKKTFFFIDVYVYVYVLCQYLVKLKL